MSPRPDKGGSDLLRLPLVCRSTTHIKDKPKRLPILYSCQNKDTIVTLAPSSAECGRDRSLPHPALAVVGNSSPANEILFQVPNLHLGQTSPPTPHLAIELVELMQEGVGGSLKEKTKQSHRLLSPLPSPVCNPSTNTQTILTLLIN